MTTSGRWPDRADSWEDRLRREAMAWLTVRTHDGARSVARSELADFQFDGRPFRLIPTQTGIWKPATMTSALSIVTTYRRPGQARPYDDAVGTDGLLRYKWRKTDPHSADNRALRAAKDAELPLIWFLGVGDAHYQPVFPVYLLWEEPAAHQFVIDPDVAKGLVSPRSPVEAELRRYIVRETRQRLHQPRFRATVLRAYAGRCAVFALRHPELLDAAHIVADGDEDGVPVVRNGLALCKIHHAAYDAGILGVRPDLVVQIRPDLLVEVDGPMLQHGLVARHGQRLLALPRARAEQPDPDRLDRRYASFLRGA